MQDAANIPDLFPPCYSIHVSRIQLCYHHGEYGNTCISCYSTRTLVLGCGDESTTCFISLHVLRKEKFLWRSVADHFLLQYGIQRKITPLFSQREEKYDR